MNKHKNRSAQDKSVAPKQAVKPQPSSQQASSQRASNQRASNQRASSQWAGQGRLADLSWPAIAAGVGAMVVWSLLAPVDSVSVFMGSALSQNLGWLALGACAAFASRFSATQYSAVRYSAVRFEPTRAELTLVVSGLVWLIAVTWMSSSRGDSRAVWNGFWQVISLSSCFYIARGLVQSSRVRTAMVWLVVVGCVALSIQGLEQVLVSMPASRAEYLKDPERMLLEQGIDAPPDSPRRKQFEDRLNSPEPFATFALANSLATLLSLGVVLNSGLLLGSVMAGRGKQVMGGSAEDKDVRVNWLGISALAVMLAIQLICLLLTRSRTAYLAVVVAIGVWVVLELLRGKVQLSRRALQISGGLITAVLLLGLGWLLTVDSLVWSEAPKSISYRLEYWQATLQMIREWVWTGVGLGNFQNYYPQYKLEQASEIIADPHNWVLDIAATLSLPIALLVVGWLAVTLMKAVSGCLNEANFVAAEMDGAESTTRNANAFRYEEVAQGTGQAVGVREDVTLVRREARSQYARQERRLVGCLLGGAALGGLAAVCLLSLLGSLDFLVMITAWILAVVLGSVGWWSRWQFEKQSDEQFTNLEHAQSEFAANGDLSQANLVAAVLVVLLCLLASGSWQASGIAVPFLIMVAMHWRLMHWRLIPDEVGATTQTEEQSGSLASGSFSSGSFSSGSFSSGSLNSGAWAAIACVAVLIFIQQTWRPVTQGWVLEAQATSARSLGEQLRLIELAAAADPLDVERRLHVGQLKSAQVGSIQDPETFTKQATLLLEELKALSPPDVVGYLTPKLAGQLAFELAATAERLRQPNEVYLAAAKGFYSAAVERYPSSVELQMQLAAVAAIDEDWALAASSVQRATELSDRSPHSDKKLGAQLIWLPLSPAGYESQTGYVPAEPLAAWLRTQSKAAPPG